MKEPRVRYKCQVLVPLWIHHPQGIQRPRNFLRPVLLGIDGYFSVGVMEFIPGYRCSAQPEFQPHDNGRSCKSPPSHWFFWQQAPSPDSTLCLLASETKFFWRTYKKQNKYRILSMSWGLNAISQTASSFAKVKCSLSKGLGSEMFQIWGEYLCRLTG